MWDETLIESKRIRGSRNRWLTFPISLLAHVAVVAIVIGTSYWYVEALTARAPLPVVFHTIITPPAQGDGGLAEHAKRKPEPVSETKQIQPITVPDLVPEKEPPVKQQTESEQTGLEGSTPGTIDGMQGGTGSESGPWGVGISGEQAEEKVIRLTPEIREPVLIRKVKPEYPLIAIRARIQGFVFLEAVISKTGTVEDLREVQSAHPILTQAALEAVRQWRYQPARLNGRPVRVYFNVTVEFKLH